MAQSIKYKMPSALPDPKAGLENAKERQFGDESAKCQQILIEPAGAPIGSKNGLVSLISE
jgi:hypothetical protein